jgi:hypothetical protein
MTITVQRNNKCYDYDSILVVHIDYKYDTDFWFEKIIKPKHLINEHSFFNQEKNKLERLLFISNLKYTIIHIFSITFDIMVYLYNLKDFNRYLEILKIINPENKYTYDKEEFREFF